MTTDGVVYVQMISNHYLDVAPSLLLFTDRERAIFNVPEGTQRLCLENKVKLAKISTVFLTELSAETTGGLPGMVLTIADSAADKLRIVGPPGIQAWWAAVSVFLPRPNFHVTIVEVASDEDVFMVGDVKVMPKLFRCAIESEANDASSTVESNESKRRRRGNDGSYVMDSKPKELLNVVYTVQCVDYPGKFDAAKAKALGVPPGPLFGALSKGECVQVPNSDRVVHPGDVRGSASLGAAAVIANLRQPQFFPAVAAAITTGHCDARPCCVFHMADTQLYTSEAYTAWTRSLGQKVKHVLINRREFGDVVSYRKSFALIQRYHSMSSDFFPLPKCESTVDAKMQSRAHYLMQPSAKVALSSVNDTANDESAQQEAAMMQAITSHEKFPEVVKLFDNWKVHAQEPCDWSVEIFGTGSACPSSYRNVSATMVNSAKEKMRIVFDCGEGTTGQIARKHGEEDLQQVLDEVRLIWISHLHADHHLGLPRFLSKRSHDAEMVIVVGPDELLPWLNHCGQHNAMNFTFISCRQLFSNPQLLQGYCGLDCVRCVEVDHCVDSWGVSVCHQQWKIVYSGDTMPCDRLVALGLKADLLIHEATFECGMEAEARTKKHSTTAQAIDVAERMEAKHLLLTHFSQRYPKAAATQVHSSGLIIGIAFDLMTFSNVQTASLGATVAASALIQSIEDAFSPET